MSLHHVENELYVISNYVYNGMISTSLHSGVDILIEAFLNVGLNILMQEVDQPPFGPFFMFWIFFSLQMSLIRYSVPQTVFFFLSLTLLTYSIDCGVVMCNTVHGGFPCNNSNFTLSPVQSTSLPSMTRTDPYLQTLQAQFCGSALFQCSFGLFVSTSLLFFQFCV